MIRLVVPTENVWLDLFEGVRVQVRPYNTALDMAAQSEGTRRTAAEQREATAAAEAGQPLDATEFNAANDAALNGMFYQYQTEALARMGILAWSGIGDDAGEPLPITPDAIVAFAAIPRLAIAFRNAYSATAAPLAAEGNASAPTSAGATAAGASTASDAPSDQASPATPSAVVVENAPPS